jgi:hypothetical protein
MRPLAFLTFLSSAFLPDADNLNNSKTVWTRARSLGDTWLFLQVHLTTGSIPVGAVSTLLGFKGVRGSGYKGDIALDDVVIREGVCPPVPSELQSLGIKNDWNNKNDKNDIIYQYMVFNPN